MTNSCVNLKVLFIDIHDFSKQSCAAAGLLFILYAFLRRVLINVKFPFLDSTPVNGEQKEDDMSVEDKPKSPAQEDNNCNPASSPTRWASPEKHVQCLSPCLVLWPVSHSKGAEVCRVN